MRKFLESFRCPQSLIARLTSPTFEDIKLAIWKQDIEKISQLLAEGAATHKKNQSILHYATLENKIEVIDYLVSHYSDLVNQKNQSGDTPIMIALFAGNFKIVKMLLPYANHNIRDSNGNTAFIIAAANGNIPAMQAMLENGHNPLLRNFQGQTALHRASYYGQLESIKYLLEHTSLRLCQTDRNNNTSLHLCCMSCNIVCIRYMLCKVKDPQVLLEQRNKQNKEAIEVLQEMINRLNQFRKDQKMVVDKQKDGKTLKEKGIRDHKGVIDFQEVREYIFGGFEIKFGKYEKD